jgi:hypothetical protein
MSSHSETHHYYYFYAKNLLEMVLKILILLLGHGLGVQGSVAPSLLKFVFNLSIVFYRYQVYDEIVCDFKK